MKFYKFKWDLFHLYLNDNYLNENLFDNLSKNLDILILNVINNINNQNSLTNSLKNFENKVKSILSNI